ncbi:MAG: glycosyltransferase family 2 protein [Acidobacteriia bacterium]|nr:glycosyltransferase family 2 protein [Terriglobia bacterium]
MPHSGLLLNTTQDQPQTGNRPDASVIVISYNTRRVLRQCLETVGRDAGPAESNGVRFETLVVDNGSRDGSPEMVESQFPWVRLIQTGANLGFAAANNRALPLAQGRYLILLNSDAFCEPGAIERAIAHMDADPGIGLGGGRLIGKDDSWQPSARLFPSLFNDFASLSGLAHRYRKSRLWGRADRTWADLLEPTEADWVPGAFSIIRREALQKAGAFDESFFLYYEEVDLCRRIKAAGYRIHYWPDVVIVHLGGESSKSLGNQVRSRSGAQLTLWRLRSGFLYYRKHHGYKALLAGLLELVWHSARALRNGLSSDPRRQEKAAESRALIRLLAEAWKETRGGRVSPPRPW